MKSSFKLIACATALLIPLWALAATSWNWQPADKAVNKLEPSLNQLSQKTNLTIKYPKMLYIPTNKIVYVYGDPTTVSNSMYTLNIDTTSDCHGAKYCTLGYLQAQVGANPEIYYDMNNQEITAPVTLKNSQKAYFTMAHAMGDYWPAMLSWRDGKVLYTLSWSTPSDDPKNQLSILKQMAESV